jgi:hypothetical protein
MAMARVLLLGKDDRFDVDIVPWVGGGETGRGQGAKPGAFSLKRSLNTAIGWHTMDTGNM